VPGAVKTKGTPAAPTSNAIIQFAIDFLRSDEFREWVEAGRRRAQEAQERALQADDQAATMTSEVKAQERKVERLVDALTSADESEFIVQRLKAEEAKLTAMRGKLTALARSTKPRKLPAIDVEDLIRDLRSLKTLTEKDPVAAREALRSVVESVVLKPVGDEYEATLAFKKSTTALAGGRVLENSDCGGRI